MDLDHRPCVALAVGEELGADLLLPPSGSLLLQELVVLGHGVVSRGDLQVGVAGSRAEGRVGRLDAERSVKVGVIDPRAHHRAEVPQPGEQLRELVAPLRHRGSEIADARRLEAAVDDDRS